MKNSGFVKKSYNLNSVAKNITLNNNKYILRGVINYIDSIRHYMALLFTNIAWYEYDDLKPKRIAISPIKYEVTPHVLLCTQIK